MEKNINYINKNFDLFRDDLVRYAQTYFPEKYNDFSDASVGMMFIEMASYLGDVLSFYTDIQIQENFSILAQERKNLLNMAYVFGHNPKSTSPSFVDVDVYQIVPSKLSGSSYVPDLDYALKISANTKLNTLSSIDFLLQNDVDFAINNSFDPIEITLQTVDANNIPEYFLLRKRSKAYSGTTKSTQVTFGTPERYKTINLPDTDIIQIVSISDSQGNTWYEVPYLGQETIFEEVPNVEANDPELYQYNDTTPYLLKLRKISRRFTTRLKNDGTLDIQFGGGNLSVSSDEEIIPNPNNVGLGVINSISKLSKAYDPSNFLQTNTYGITPSNTTLTINYVVGGGTVSNIPANDIISIDGTPAFSNSSFNGALAPVVRSSVTVSNISAGTGGKGQETIEELRQNILASFSSQLRAVTKEDYIIRALSMPSKYGSIAKAYAVQDSTISTNNPTDSIIDTNPLALSLYVLGYDNNKKLNFASRATKENLKTYISKYRILTDAINIKDAFIINIGINFDIIVSPGFSNNEVINNCILSLTNYFNVDKWQINQPIYINELYTALANIKGVSNVRNISIVNKAGESNGYSKYYYDINSATRNGVIYPSLDPSIFELKNPTTDILGRVVTF